MKNVGRMLLPLVLAACTPQANAPPPKPSVAAPTNPGTIPDTAPGRLFRGWLEAFNRGEEAHLQDFIAAHYSETVLNGQTPAERVKRALAFRADIGGSNEVVRVERSTPTEIEILCNEKDGLEFLKVSFAIDPQKPELIAMARFETMPPPADLLPPLPLPELAKDIDKRLMPLAAAGDFSGVVLLAKDGKPMFEKPYGYANREEKLPNTLDTRFRLGSQNKMFTSVAIAQLVEQGKLAYTDTVAKVLPDYPNQEVAKKITVHHLLTHSSGLGDIFGEAFDKTKDNLHTVRDYLSLFVNDPLAFEPGAKFEYSNAGFIVLGLIIEKISGQDYYEYVRSHIYEPAGMTTAGSTPRTDKTPHIALGYTRYDPSGADVPLHPNADTLPWRGMSAGGGEATAHDMLAFANALTSNKLVGPALTQKITTGVIATGRGRETLYGYGFFDSVEGGQRIVGHGGGAPGMNTDLLIYWNAGVTLIVLTNLDPPIAQRVSHYLQARLSMP